MRRLLPLLASVAVLAAACGGGGDDTTAADRASGVWPHDFVADTVAGGSIDAGDYAGQDLVLWFWAPW